MKIHCTCKCWLGVENLEGLDFLNFPLIFKGLSFPLFYAVRLKASIGKIKTIDIVTGMNNGNGNRNRVRGPSREINKQVAVAVGPGLSTLENLPPCQTIFAGQNVKQSMRAFASYQQYQRETNYCLQPLNIAQQWPISEQLVLAISVHRAILAQLHYCSLE